MLYDMTPNSQFTSGQCDGLLTTSGAIKPSGQIYQAYPPGATVPLYGSSDNPYLVADYTSNGDPTFTLPINKKALTAGDSVLVVVGNSVADAGLSSISDSQGNSYTIDNASKTDRPVAFAYQVEPVALATSDTITITLGGSGAQVRVQVLGLPGVTAVDRTPAGNGSSEGSSPSASTGTLSAANELCVRAITSGGTTDPSSLSWTLTENTGSSPISRSPTSCPGRRRRRRPSLARSPAVHPTTSE
jgi:hypothetical protein